MSEKKFSFTFRDVNGMQLRLAVDPNEFTLWDDTAQQWILDASTIAEEPHFTVGSNLQLKGVRLEKSETNYVGEVQFQIEPRKP